MAMKIPLLDEQDFDQPEALFPLPDQDINKHNNFAWYFYNSQFNEPASNNTAVLNAHVNDPKTYDIIHDRNEFERILNKIPGGLQFVVAGEPQGDGQPWLYQRQMGVVNAENKVDRYVEGNWYNQGTRIMQAPSVLDVVRTRLLTVSTRLQQVAELSQKMTHWSPATGYSYFPASYEGPKSAETQSRIGSPTPAHPEEEEEEEESAVASATLQPSDSTDQTTTFSDALFLHSLMLTNRHGDEFMDENPLKGEPGAFIFTNTKNAVDERNKSQQPQQPQQQDATPPPQQLQQQAPLLMIDTKTHSQPPSVVNTPRAAVGTPAPTPIAAEAGHGRKTSMANGKEKKRERRKSKGLASPTTPGAAS